MAKKVTASFSVPAEFLQECRDAVAFLAGPPEHLTLSKLAQRALRKELDFLKRKYNQNMPFPVYLEKIKTGRPVVLGSKKKAAE